MFEYEDVRDGDYATERERVRAIWESQAVHHRGRRRSRQTRSRERWERAMARHGPDFQRWLKTLREWADRSADLPGDAPVPWV